MKMSTRQRRGAAARAIKRDAMPNAATIYLDSLAATGRRSVRCQLRTALAILGYEGEVERFRWSSLGYEHMAMVRARMVGEGYAPATVNLTLAGLKGVLGAAFNLGVIDAERLLRGKAVKGVRCQRTPRGKSLTAKQLDKLLAQCERGRGARGARDVALVSLMAVTGLRRAEVCALQLEHLTQRCTELLVLSGKGNRDRTCPIPASAAVKLRCWLRYRGTEKGPLFCPIDANGAVQRDSLSTQVLYGIIKHHGGAAGLGHLSPHDLRRTFVSRLLDAGVDINQVRQLVGHSDVSTTSRYDRRTVDARRLLSVAFGK